MGDNMPNITIRNPKFFNKRAVIIAVVIVLLTWLWARAEISYPVNLWKGLIAEDVSGGYKGMYAVACCTRNRLNAGMTHGLVAMKRKDLDRFVKREGKRYELMAKDIIRKVFTENAPDITLGATHYEAVERYGLPGWARSMVRTVKIGEHTFFKPEFSRGIQNKYSNETRTRSFLR